MPVPRMTCGAAVLAVLIAGLAGCSGTTSAQCDQPIREQLDPAYLVHVVDATTARFHTDPPTSGPHIAGAAPTGVVDQPMLGAVQVTILERGDVLIQYRTDLAAADVAALEARAGNRTVVAPNPTLPAPVVATAWTYKLSCRGLDTAALERFVHAHAGKATRP